ELKLPSNPKLLKVVRCGVSHLCEVCGFSTEESNAVILAVDEAVSNIIKHAYNSESTEPIVINYRVFDDRLEVVLRDFGEKADPEKIKSRELDDIRPGGLGVHLIKSAMDEVHYDNSLKVGNELTLAKYLPGKKES
ncbi:MAG: ATP-binding protein, partial [bacterium]